MSQQSLEKAEHELDIQRADCRSKFWQEAQEESARLGNRRMLALEIARVFQPDLSPEMNAIRVLEVLNRNTGRSAKIAAPLSLNSQMKTPKEWGDIFDTDPLYGDSLTDFIEAVQADALANPPAQAPADQNAHVAQPLADVLNKFAGEKGEQ